MNAFHLIKTANAKINLSLDLTGVLPDGYHAINTVMQSVSLADTVTVSAGGPGISLSCSSPDVPCDEKNTAWKAAARFCEAAGVAPAVRIHIEKRIPSQAGMGGGSADAAAVLAALNEAHGYPLTDAALQGLALQIGADVPFCLAGGTRLCLNKGEILAALPPFSAAVLIAKPARGVSTAAAFRRFDTAKTLRHPNSDVFLFHLARGETDAAFAAAGNLFEQLTDVPEGEAIKRSMAENGAYYAAMTGSGSAFFGLFRSKTAAENARRALEGSVPFTAICATSEKGVE